MPAKTLTSSARRFDQVHDLRHYVIEPLSGLDLRSEAGEEQQLVLVAADSGELLLQCDLREYQNMVSAAASSEIASVDDLKTLMVTTSVNHDDPVVCR